MSQLSSFKAPVNIALIGASGGIGKAFLNHLISDKNVNHIYAFSRSNIDIKHDNVSIHEMDLTDETSIKEAADVIKDPLHIIIIASGLLHGDGLMPEKSLRDLNQDAFEQIFAVNTFGPALIAKYFLPHIPREEKSVFAAISARVSSISDNHMGGWYAYRASKTALNMIIKNTAIEIGRKYKKASIIGLHPGTVDTNLSAPFQGHVKHDIFTPKQSASYLLDVINQITPDQSGKLFAFDGLEIET